MVTPFFSPGSVGPSYDFQGTCEHVLVTPCNGMPSIAVVGDFLSDDLSMGRVGLRNGSKAVVLTEQLGVELRGGLTGTTTSMTTVTNLGSLEVVVTVGSGIVTLEASSIGLSVTRTPTGVSINLTDFTAITQTCGLCGNSSGSLIFGPLGNPQQPPADIMNQTNVNMFADSWMVPARSQVLRDARRECGECRGCYPTHVCTYIVVYFSPNTISCNI